MGDRPTGDQGHSEWLPPASSEPRLRMDPSGSFVDEPLPPRRGDGADWLIPAAIVVAGLVLAIAVIMSRRAPSASSEAPFTAAPQTITQTTTQPIAPPPPVVVPSPTPVISAEDSAAQKTLEDVVAAARTIRGQTGSYAAVTSFELATLLPANSYRPPTEASEGATDVSISVTPTIFSAAVMSETGVCFWIRDFEGTRSTFDSGEPCTGAAAASAVLPAWPIPPSPSGTPSVTP